MAQAHLFSSLPRIAETNEVNEDVLSVSNIECMRELADGTSTIFQVTNRIYRVIFIMFSSRNMVKKTSFRILQFIRRTMRTIIDLSEVDDLLPDIFMELNDITIIAMSKMIVMVDVLMQILTTNGTRKPGCVAVFIGANRRHMTLLLLNSPRSTLAMASGIKRDPWITICHCFSLASAWNG